LQWRWRSDPSQSWSAKKKEQQWELRKKWEKREQKKSSYKDPVRE
jgi:hypothetical protein